MAKNVNKKKQEFLKTKVEHIDITKIDAVDIVNSMKKMSFSARDLAVAADMYNRMLADRNCVIFLTIAGSTSAAGCMQIYADMVKYNMVDAIVATGASIVDMDFFEALGFSHYQGTPHVDDSELRRLYIDRIYDTYIDEEQLQACDQTDHRDRRRPGPRPYSSREFIREMGRYLAKNGKEEGLASSRPPTRTTCRSSARPSPTPAPASAWCCTSTSDPKKPRVHRLGEGLPGADGDQDRGATPRACS